MSPRAAPSKLRSGRFGNRYRVLRSIKALLETKAGQKVGVLLPPLRAARFTERRQEGLSQQQAGERERALDVVVLKDTRAFEDLEEEWEDLYHDSPPATPFQSWSWLYSWWESFGDDYDLRLIAVRDGALLVGLIPLMLERRWGFRRLHFIGKFDQLDLLAREGWEDKVFDAGIRALTQMMDSWHLVDLQAVSPEAAAWGIFRRWNGPRTHIPRAYYLFIKVKPWDELLASLSRNYRQNVRRTLRRAEEDGVRSVVVGAVETEQAARRLAALHLELRQGRHIYRGHQTSKFESFVVAAACRMTDRGLGAISEFRRDGEVLISQFAVFGERVMDAYLIGVSQEGIRRYQWSSLGIWDALNMARSRECAYVCLSNGLEPYKQRWASEEVRYRQIILGRGPVSWGLYLAYLTVRMAARRDTKAFDTSIPNPNTKRLLRRFLSNRMLSVFK